MYDYNFCFAFFKYSGIRFDNKIPNYENAIEEAERKPIIWAYSNYKTSRRVAEIIEVSQTKANNLIRKYIK